VPERIFEQAAYGNLGSPPNSIVVRQAARQLGRELPADSVAMVVTAPPGPEHGTFLCLSFLWHGWLFGSQRPPAFEQIPCSRRPIDWGAYFKAIAAAMYGLSPALRDDAPLVFVFRAESLRQCDMLVLACLAAGLQLRRVLGRPERAVASGSAREVAGEYVLEFRKARAGQLALPETEVATARELESSLRQQIDVAVRELLAVRSEPSSSFWIRLMAMEQTARSGALRAFLAASDFDGVKVGEAFAREVHDALERAERRKSLIRLGGDGAFWALPSLGAEAPPLSDRAELAVYNLLSTRKASVEKDLARVVHSLFPGLATPEVGWLDECLVSHGTKRGDGTWALGKANAMAQRLAEHTAIIAVLVELGHRFGYDVWVGRDEQKRSYKQSTLGGLLSAKERAASPGVLLGTLSAADIDVIWHEDRTPACIFEVEWTAALGDAVLRRRSKTGARRYIVLLDDRAPLVQSKLRRWPWLRQLLETDGWEFIKYRYLLAFSQSKDASRYNLGSIVGLQPVSERDHGQMNLL
jgi:hypothetical protein